MRSVIVTGGAGYIGSHVCRSLHQRGILPVTVDNLSTGHRWAVQWGPLVVGDIADRALMAATFETYQPVAVMHFSAASLVGESVTDPGRYYRNNVAGTLSLLEAMRDCRVGQLVFSSTCAVYGNPTRLPITEDLPVAPINPYGESKAMVERMLHGFSSAHGLRAVVLRYFNAAGADAQGRIGEAHGCETHLIPLAIETALGKRPHLSVFGTDYPTLDGTCVRDYIHVDDLAQAHLLALDSLTGQEGVEIYNLGIGRGYSVKQVINAVAEISGHPVATVLGPRRAGDAPELVADPARAHNRLGWRPDRSSLENIVETAWAWHSRHAASVQRVAELDNGAAI